MYLPRDEKHLFFTAILSPHGWRRRVAPIVVKFGRAEGTEGSLYATPNCTLTEPHLVTYDPKPEWRTVLNQLLMRLVMHSCERFLLRSLATASHDDEFQTAILRQFSKHTSVFSGHPVVMEAQTPSFWEEIDATSSCRFWLPSWRRIWFILIPYNNTDIRDCKGSICQPKNIENSVMSITSANYTR